MLDESGKKYRSNILALADSLIVGIAGMLSYYVTSGQKIGGPELVYMCLMAVAIWFVSMYGYDKVKQAIRQTAALNKTVKDLTPEELDEALAGIGDGVPENGSEEKPEGKPDEHKDATDKPAADEATDGPEKKSE